LTLGDYVHVSERLRPKVISNPLTIDRWPITAADRSREQWGDSGGGLSGGFVTSTCFVLIRQQTGLESSTLTGGQVNGLQLTASHGMLYCLSRCKQNCSLLAGRQRWLAICI